MLVRVAVNVTMTAQPFYLQVVLKFGVSTDPNKKTDNPTPVEMALVPLVSYLLALLFSMFVQQPMTRCLRNRFLPMAIAIALIISASIPMVFLDEDSRVAIYPLAAFQNIGLTIMLNTATSLISDVIGTDSKNSAFVYGCYSLLDKFANGAMLFVVID